MSRKEIASSSKVANLYDITTDLCTPKFVTLDALEQYNKKLLEQFYSKPLVKQTCHSCGATLEIEHDKHIFSCKYCGSCYAIGTRMVNSASN